LWLHDKMRIAVIVRAVPVAHRFKAQVNLAVLMRLSA
jgi:hypothetical protein